MESGKPIVAGMTLHGSEVKDGDNFNCPINIDELIQNLNADKK